MASLSKSYSEQKLQGKVYTPDFVVEKMLDNAGYIGSSLLGKTVLDPACGDGRFLVAAAQRIIALSAPDNLIKNLSCLNGWDIDPEAVKLCRQNLSQLVAPLGIEVDWQVVVENALLRIPHLPFNANLDFDSATIAVLPSNTIRFDFIFANPPYIRIQHLDAPQRRFLQQYYSFCKTGSTDIYIAFFELCYHLLDTNGMAAFITPNTYFYSQTAATLRRFLAEHGSVRQISNYHALQLFENATTYSAICIFGKSYIPNFIYEEACTKNQFIKKNIHIVNLLGNKIWQLSIEEIAKIEGQRLGEICQISVGITTLCDKAYIFALAEGEQWDENKSARITHVKTVLKGNIAIESTILKPIVKASTLKTSHQAIVEYVLFPYMKQNGKYKIIPENDLQVQFPLAYNYLLSVKEWLDKRDAGKPNPVAWYAFGRSQGLDSSFGAKILFSPMNKRPNFILYQPSNVTFYSGYCIKYEGSWEWLLEQLNSQRMQQYIATSSRDFRNGWKAYNKKVLEDFIVPFPPA